MITRTTRLRALKNQTRRLKSRIQKMSAKSKQYSKYRLAVFLITFVAVLTCAYFVDSYLSWILFAIGAIVFGVIAYFHKQIDGSLTRHQIWLELKTAQIARMELDWSGIPESKITSSDSNHPFEIDLDIIGEKSLHRLMDLSISNEGSRLVQEWLLQEIPDLEKTLNRQQIVHELIPETRFRNRLLLAFALISDEPLDGNKFLRWLAGHSSSNALKWLLSVSGILAAMNLMLFILNNIELILPFWIISFFLYVAIYFLNQNTFKNLLNDATFLDDELGKLRAILDFFQHHSFVNNSQLAKLCEPFWNSSPPPLKQLRKVKRIATFVGLRMNPLMGVLLNAVVPWDFYCARRLAKYKREFRELLPQWLNALNKLEALISLANFSYLNPNYTFPKIERHGRSKDVLRFEAKEIGHPLIPHEQKVCNDFHLNGAGSIALITGSNMAGKSTFLRTVGINLCLANAGAPVNAGALQTSMLRVFACIKFSDSITDGYSFFYAEVRRLKKLLQELNDREKPPIIFLIDEIFKGTNNRERLIGGRSFIRALAHQKGTGIVTTHDLDLVKLAEEIPSLANYHFREEVANGRMEFDYLLREGPCPTTNALKIMKMEGLPVEVETG